MKPGYDSKMQRASGFKREKKHVELCCVTFFNSLHDFIWKGYLIVRDGDVMTLFTLSAGQNNICLFDTSNLCLANHIFLLDNSYLCIWQI